MKEATKNQLESNLGKLYWMHFLGSTNFHLVVYTLFLLSKGFSMTQFFIIESGGMVSKLLAEIPTGMFADRIGRKWSLILSYVPGIFVMPVFIISDSFIVCLIIMSLGGLWAAFASGADSAILYDTLIGLEREKEFKKTLGKFKWGGAWSGAFAGILAGFMANYGLAYPWWAGYFVGFPMLFLTINLVEPPIHREGQRESGLKHLGQSLRLSFTGSSGYFVLYASTIWTFFVLGFFLWQPYLKLTGLALAFFGIFYALESIVSGLVSRYAHGIELKVGMKASLLLIPLVLALAFILESQFAFVLGFLFIFIQSISSGYFSPVLEDYVNSRIPSSKRATILSIKNMMHSLSYAIISPLLGYFIDLYSLQAALLGMGIMLILVATIFFVASERRSN
jgi:MFS family permease